MAMTIGQSIAFFRQKAGLTQLELCEKLGKTSGWISLIEADKRNVKFSLIQEVAEALGIPTFFIVFMTDEINGEVGEKVSYLILKGVNDGN